MLHRAGLNLARIIFITLALVALSDTETVATSSQASQLTNGSNSGTESYVLAQLKKGEIAELCTLPDDRRVIKASFLKQLLTNSAEGGKVASFGVRIKDAVIDGPLELDNEKIPYSVSLIGCDFQGLVKFYHVSIVGDLNISDHFVTLDACDETTSPGLPTIFRNRALFINVTIEGDLLAQRTHFQWQHPSSCKDCDWPTASCDAADFEEVKVGNDAIFDGAVFDGFADFEGAHFAQIFSAEKATFNDKADFVDIRVKDDAEFKGATFASAADFTRAKIENKFGIPGTSFKDSHANFQDIQIGQLTLNRDTNFEGYPQANVGGMTYQRIAYQPPDPKEQGTDAKTRIIAQDKGEDEQVWELWLNVIENSDYRVDAYTTLEDFIQKQGQPKRANEIYIRLRDREASEALHKSWFPGILRWVWDWFLKWTVGYGRRPWLALIYSLFIIAIGCYLFPRSNMRPRDGNHVPLYYNRLWYSTDLYLPVVDLQANEAWMPNKVNHPILWHYMHVHALLGWILVPIGLAALTGIIK